MVQLTRIYTRGGDKGKTSLGNGQRLSKHHLRIEAIGTVDEANATLGLARLYVAPEMDVILQRIQNDLFDLGADLCMPTDPEGYEPLRIVASQVDRLEQEIDAMNAKLQPLNSFILPGGTPASSYLHLCRTIVRRAERITVALGDNEPVNPEVLRYLNRLSDHHFVMGRYLNNFGAGDVLWQPGKERV
ncbi:MAG: cob(I)yrinic acid a,c-diamide adenosyltransferase [Holosporales bacterium]